ncbi:MAG: trypsin-like peptidase domain-containing protein [Deltaproteobacteria bacterium]|nr:trypsin-like peptidase domain-containing protein [Deltaproteobacteria bacterium]
MNAENVRDDMSVKVPGVGVALGLLILGLSAGPAWGNIDRATRVKVMKQVVKLRVLVKQRGRWVERGHGSGTIISADGLILTNNHVIQDQKTGRLFDAIAVAPNTGFDAAPKAICVAWPRRAIRHPKLDLAIIKCEANLQGRPLRKKLHWPMVSLGDSRTLVPGDDIYVVGFPAVGGATISFTSGKVSGFLADRRVGTGRVWIKTDALISGGVSGGAAFDEGGKLIGVPTAYRRGSRGATAMGLVRVIQKAKPMIALARRRPWRTAPRVARVMPKPRVEAPDLRGYPRKLPRNARPMPRRLPPMPGYRGGARPGRDVPDGARPGRRSSRKRSRRLGRLALPRAGSGLSVISGRVVDAYSSRPVVGAVVLVLRPGINVYRVTEGTLRRGLSTAGVSDRRGFFIARKALRQGHRHGLIVVAKGYAPLRLNKAISVFRGGPPELNVGLVKLRRAGIRRPLPRERLPQFESGGRE